MVRKVLGVVGGYVVMAVFVFVTFTLTYLAIGTEGAFQPNSYEVSGLWIVASIVLGFIGAVLGGLISFTIGMSKAVPKILAGVVLVLGIALAIPTLSADASLSLVRTGEVSVMAAMQSAHQPAWLAFLNPVLGAAGVMVGARLKKESRPKSTA